jgi:hypothetical protein
MCKNETINGVMRDGGYAEYVTLRTEAVVNVPAEVDPAEYCPILCAGITVFNSLRKQNITQGELVGVQGLGGLGHLALQYANKMGYRVVAISSSADKEDFARKLGAQVSKLSLGTLYQQTDTLPSCIKLLFYLRHVLAPRSITKKKRLLPGCCLGLCFLICSQISRNILTKIRSMLHPLITSATIWVFISSSPLITLKET